MVCGVRPHAIALLINAAIHVTIFVIYGVQMHQLWRFVLSFFFFIYPCSYVVDIFWSVRPAVRRVLTGEVLINRKHFMNAPRREVKASDLLPVTVSIPVYLEENAVIFETVERGLRAIRSYQSYGAGEANVLISEDGLSPLLGGSCSREAVERLMQSYEKNPENLSPKEKKAAERIRFYREKGVGFVARPAKGRAGLFKKASNLNYTLRFGDSLKKDAELGREESEDSLTAQGYAEGDYRTHEIILLLDKDSGVREGIIEAIVPEFATDGKLAYVQCATDAVNLRENYYSRVSGHLTNDLFHYIWPCKALQGFFVPLVGHNVFLRKSILEKCGRWSENKVSEDYDLAIRLYGMGYHGKYAKIPGLEFTEYTSTNFEEETGKQRRYAYGLMEMVFDGTLHGHVRPCDRFFMFLYFLSMVNQIMLLPTVFIECYFGNIHLLWAGFLLCDAIFILPPVIRSLIMGRKIPKEHRSNILITLEMAASFISHSLSVFLGAVGWVVNKFKRKKKAFPSTRVGVNERGLIAGLRLIFGYIRGTWIFIPVALLCADRTVYVLTRHGIRPASRIAYCFIFFSMVLTPVLFTPPLYAFGSGEKKAKKNVSKKNSSKKEKSRGWSMSTSLPEVVAASAENSLENDIESFLKGYGEDLAADVAKASLPAEITSRYEVTGCLKKDETGKKETYFLKRLSDGIPAILRITRGYDAEDALTEARLLTQLDYPGIPKVYASFEKDDGHYLVREYMEGRTLDEIVRTKGTLSEDDIFSIVTDLCGILKYLHHQTPPVIHRDIKPQNIVLGADGSINLIDFGIAREHKIGHRQDTSIILTLDYAPPEQYGFDQSSPLTDIYALGMVMLYLATGQVAKPNYESEINSPRLRNLIQKCVAFDPENRIQRVEEIENYVRSKTIRKGQRILKAALLAAACAVAVAGSNITGRILGEAEGEKSGHRTGYDSGYVSGYQGVPVFTLGERITHPEDGNLPGNVLVDGGAYALSYENRIYYIHDGNIYRMSPDGSNVEELVSGKNASGISAYKGWLYYTAGGSIWQYSLYEDTEHIVFSGGADTQMIVLDDSYYVKTAGTLYALDVEAWKTEKADPDFVSEYASRSVSDKTAENVKAYNPLQTGFTSRGIVLVDGYDGMLWLSNPKGNMRTRVTKNRTKDFNIAGEWIFYHNLDDGGNLWSVRYDGADDHKVTHEG